MPNPVKEEARRNRCRKYLVLSKSSFYSFYYILFQFKCKTNMTHGGIKTYQLRAQWMQSYKAKTFQEALCCLYCCCCCCCWQSYTAKTFQETLCWPLLPGKAEEAKESTNSKRKSEAGNLKSLHLHFL